MKEYKKLVAQRRRRAVYRNQIKYGELAIQRSETALVHCVRLEGGEAEKSRLCFFASNELAIDDNCYLAMAARLEGLLLSGSKTRFGGSS